MERQKRVRGKGESRMGRDRAKDVSGSSPVNAGLGVSDLVEARYPEPVGAPTLPLVHEVTNG